MSSNSIPGTKNHASRIYTYTGIHPQATMVIALRLDTSNNYEYMGIGGNDSICKTIEERQEGKKKAEEKLKQAYEEFGKRC